MAIAVVLANNGNTSLPYIVIKRVIKFSLKICYSDTPCHSCLHKTSKHIEYVKRADNDADSLRCQYSDFFLLFIYLMHKNLYLTLQGTQCVS